jgi:hypothetical protein
VNIPSEARIGKAGRDAPAIRCVHLADKCSIAHGRDWQTLLSRITVKPSTWQRILAYHEAACALWSPFYNVCRIRNRRASLLRWRRGLARILGQLQS